MQPQTKVKICGITRLSDAELAVDLGAWAVGMVFYEASPRRCSLPEAQLISRALRRRVEVAGVFVNAPLEQIAGLSEELGLSIVQLHGDEGPSFCAEVARRTGAKVCKAAQVSDVGDVRDVERFHVDYHLLDARSEGKSELRGGTGETFDWSLLSSRRSKVPLLLSGGLGPENVAAAIEAIHPFGVDTASGTEEAPGIKDERKLRDLFAAVASTQSDVAGVSEGVSGAGGAAGRSEGVSGAGGAEGPSAGASGDRGAQSAGPGVSGDRGGVAA